QTEAMYRDGARVFVELGPKAVLSGLVGRILDGRPHVAVSIDRTPGLEGLLGVLAQLLCAGVHLEITRLFTNRATPLSDPYDLPAAPVVPKHAWLINGSGARPLGTPAKQVGLTLEDAQRLEPAAPAPVATAGPAPLEPAPVLPVVAADPPTPQTPVEVPPRPLTPSASARPATSPPPPSSSPAAPLSANRRSKVSPMTDHDPTTMNGYFQMMRAFLETQERVMSMVLRAQPGVQPERRVPAERVLPAVALHEIAASEAIALPSAAPKAAPVARPTNGHAKPAAAAAVVQPTATSTAPPPVATAAPPPPPPSNGAQAAAKPGNGHLDREALTELLLRVVEDKTGYPRDMVSLTQNLESDLGIDSIKRVEVATAMLEFLPEAHRAVLTAKLGQLNTQPTLEGMLGILNVNGQNGATVPFDVAEAGSVTEDIGHPPRYVVVAREQAIEPAAARRIRTGHFVVTDDALGVADDVARRLVDAGCTVSRVPLAIASDEDALARWMSEHEPATLAGIVHLASLGAASVAADASGQEWRRELMLHEKSLFSLLHGWNRKLVDDGHVLAASGLGGTFGRECTPGRPGLQLQGGALGLLKSHREERPGLRVRAVDVDTGVPVAAIAAALFDELALVGGRIEVGYPAGRRTAFHTVAMPVAARERSFAGARRVILATGGGRGVTAELVRELAAPGTALVVTGRRPLEPEPADTASASSAAELRERLIAQVRSGAIELTPAEIGKRVQAILAARELGLNLADFARRGATVEYHAVDVTDEASLRAMILDVQGRLGAITGIVHGAGIIEDKLVADKTSDSWSRVVETKVLGLLLLQKLVRPEHLEFLAVMSSVAGRFGNSGQGDYATANELMNRLCCQLRAGWADRVNVMALCWGPWGPTDFGQGMVSASVEAKFAEKGVRLVSAAIGRRLFADELARGDRTPVEIVCGEGPWEETEAQLGAVEIAAPTSAPTSQPTVASKLGRGPLLGNAEIEVLPKGERILGVQLDGNHTYLAAHRIDGVAILPAAAAVELFAEAGEALWPGWKVVEVRDCRVLKGIDLDAPERTLQLEVGLPTYGSSEGFEVDAFLRSPAADGRPARTHYRCVLRFAQLFPESFALTP
ncbi:MAG TPA: SDR family NAD(P)-dependent oxidoreductase, partial [Nannocystaceae bacterium]|nr:SDR family NAD(P)-dependent oxidoreductase [Nannocystaceae bacterium]